MLLIKIEGTRRSGASETYWQIWYRQNGSCPVRQHMLSPPMGASWRTFRNRAWRLQSIHLALSLVESALMLHDAGIIASDCSAIEGWGH
ncbi:hypothetical protein EN935_39505 [Mesorhizobium sp. M7D.F.Ca.US.004.03.1.1]|nr:hypothetical protein EN935_39505 [Mesorhizobium sp. M7D.F.Ca.US.004.03.1.1]